MSDHDHLRGEVRVRFSAPPSDVADQNPHDGCHRLHHHSHDSGHLHDLSSQGGDTIAATGVSSLNFLFYFYTFVSVNEKWCDLLHGPSYEVSALMKLKSLLLMDEVTLKQSCLQR